MNVTQMTCPACGAPLAWGGAVSTPGQGPEEEASVLLTWTCGHQAIVPLSAIRARQAQQTPAEPPTREQGSGDYDRPYRYERPTVDQPGPFSERELARLLVLRGRAQDGAFVADGCPGLMAGR